MVTLGIGLMLYEAANQATSITGGVDGLSGVEMRKMFGVFGFGLDGKTAYVYSLVVLFVVFCFARTLVRSPFGLSPARHSRGRATDARDRRIGAAQADRGLHDRRGHRGHRRRAARADDAIRRHRYARVSRARQT